MYKYNKYLRLQNTCNTLKTDCEKLTLSVSTSTCSTELINSVNRYLEINRDKILKECALDILKRRDAALIECKDELETLLRHIKDITDVPNNANNQE